MQRTDRDVINNSLRFWFREKFDKMENSFKELQAYAQPTFRGGISEDFHNH